MNISADYFLEPFLWLSVITAIIVLIVAAYFSPWKALLQKSERQHAFCAAWLSLVVMMLLQISWVDGVSIHFLMMTSLVVVFGWSLSVIIGASAQLMLALWFDQLSLVLSVNFLLAVVVPAAVSYAIFRWIILHKSKNLFVFLLGGGFFGSIATLLVSLLVLGLVLLVNQQWSLLQTLYDKSLMVVLLSYSEGFLNGLIVTALTVFFPSLVRTFDEKKYLDS
ncbi:MAG: energy-coupling factor ABC transporter permease [Pseudomonadales bacterium]|nr:energy-coupling factor ABC transporter permease [Pseudomonadales bacterium]